MHDSTIDMQQSYEIDCRMCGDWEEAAFYNDGTPMPICVFCAF